MELTRVNSSSIGDVGAVAGSASRKRFMVFDDEHYVNTTKWCNKNMILNAHSRDDGACLH